MVILQPGVWPETAFTDRTWMDDLWPEYGAGSAGVDSSRYYYLRPPVERGKKREVLLMIRQLLEVF